MAAWSKLQKSLYLIVSDKADFQIHCSVYRMKSQRGSTDLPRYWITIGKEIIFDYPKQFINSEENKNYPYETQISDISDCIRELRLQKEALNFRVELCASDSVE